MTLLFDLLNQNIEITEIGLAIKKGKGKSFVMLLKKLIIELTKGLENEATVGEAQEGIDTIQAMLEGDHSLLEEKIQTYLEENHLIEAPMIDEVSPVALAAISEHPRSAIKPTAPQAGQKAVELVDLDVIKSSEVQLTHLGKERPKGSAARRPPTRHGKVNVNEPTGVTDLASVAEKTTPVLQRETLEISPKAASGSSSPKPTVKAKPKTPPKPVSTTPLEETVTGVTEYHMVANNELPSLAVTTNILPEAPAPDFILNQQDIVVAPVPVPVPVPVLSETLPNVPNINVTEDHEDNLLPQELAHPIEAAEVTRNLIDPPFVPVRNVQAPSDPAPIDRDAKPVSGSPGASAAEYNGRAILPNRTEQDRLKDVLRHYKYSNGSRYHLFAANPKTLDDRFKHYQGDELKTKILLEFQQQLDNAALNTITGVIQEIKGSPQYKILQTTQGLFSSLFWKLIGRKTDSEIAIEKMIAEAEANFSKPDDLNNPKF